MSTTLSFKERMALRQQQLAQGIAPTEPVSTPAATVVPTPEPTPVPTVAYEDLSFKEKLALAKAGHLPPTPAAPPSPAATAVAEPTDEPEPLPTVIRAMNDAEARGQQTTLGAELAGTSEVADIVKSIQQKIYDLGKVEDGHLRFEMGELKRLLEANPSACVYLLDEDIGRATLALRRMTDNRVAQDMGRAKPSARSAASTLKPLSAADLAAAFDDL